MRRRESAQYAAQHIMGLASGVYDYLPYFYRRGHCGRDCMSTCTALTAKDTACRVYMLSPVVVA